MKNEVNKDSNQDKQRQPLDAEQAVVMLACLNKDFLAKLSKLADEEGIKLVLTNEQVMYDYIAKQDNGINESERMAAFLKDERNRKIAFAHAQELYRILTKSVLGKEDELEDASKYTFTKKQLVHATTLSWRKAEEILNTLEIFGFVIIDKKTDFYFQFDYKSIIEQVKSNAAVSVENLNLDIWRFKAVLEQSDIEDKEKEFEEFKNTIQNNIAF